MMFLIFWGAALLFMWNNGALNPFDWAMFALCILQSALPSWLLLG
jgi:hypothetical protein